MFKDNNISHNARLNHFFKIWKKYIQKHMDLRCFVITSCLSSSVNIHLVTHNATSLTITVKSSWKSMFEHWTLNAFLWKMQQAN